MTDGRRELEQGPDWGKDAEAAYLAAVCGMSSRTCGVQL